VQCTSAPGGAVGCGGPLGTCEFFFSVPTPAAAGDNLGGSPFDLIDWSQQHRRVQVPLDGDPLAGRARPDRELVEIALFYRDRRAA